MMVLWILERLLCWYNKSASINRNTGMLVMRPCSMSKDET